MPSMPKSTLPVSSPSTVSALPLYGMMAKFVPVSFANNSAASRPLVVPVPKLSFPGRALSVSSRSCTVCAAESPRTSSTEIFFAPSEIGSKSLAGS